MWKGGKAMKMKKYFITVILLFVFAVKIVFAQTTASQKDTLDNDPIVAMLDSLVSLNFMNRCNFPDAKSSVTPYERVNFSDDIIREKLKKLQSPIPMDYNQYVKMYIDLYSNKRPFLTSKVLGLSKLYFPMFEQILDQQELPLEFKYLAVVESALNPVAVSRAGATGLWQFMYNTGKLYNLNITSYIDERRDPYKATLAACQYFKNMYAIYHDWLLVIAAYNCGERNVNRAILRAGGKTNFWEIKRFLPRETQGYVPAFIAVNYVMGYAADHNIPVTPPIISYYETDTVSITQQVSFEQIASITDVSVDVLHYLNPIYKKNFIPYMGDQSYKIVLPSGKIAVFMANADKIYNKVDSALDKYEYVTTEVKKIYVVKKEEGLTAVARKNDCLISDIKQWNNMRKNYVVPGQKLVLYETVVQKIPKNIADTTDAKTAAAVDSTKTTILNNAGVKYVYHIIQPGDTLYSIAQKYQGITVEQLKEINKIKDGGNNLTPGMKLKVMIAG